MNWLNFQNKCLSKVCLSFSVISLILTVLDLHLLPIYSILLFTLYIFSCIFFIKLATVTVQFINNISRGYWKCTQCGSVCACVWWGSLKPPGRFVKVLTWRWGGGLARLTIVWLQHVLPELGSFFMRGPTDLLNSLDLDTLQMKRGLWPCLYELLVWTQWPRSTW